MYHKKKISVALAVLSLSAVVAGCGIASSEKGQYKEAFSYMEQGNYENAIEYFQLCPDYKDSADQILECKYQIALQHLNNGSLQEALAEFDEIGNYKDAKEYAKKCRYNHASEMLANQSYLSAAEEFSKLGDYQDSLTKVKECYYEEASHIYEEYGGTSFEQTEKMVELFASAGDYKDAKDRITDCWSKRASVDFSSRKYDECLEAYSKIEKLTAEQFYFVNRCYYELGAQAFLDGDYDRMRDWYSKISPDMDFYDQTETYFETLEDAKEYIISHALNADESIKCHIGELTGYTQSQTQQENPYSGFGEYHSNDFQNSEISTLRFLAQSVSAYVNFQQGDQPSENNVLVIRPIYYPGTRIVAAVKNDKLPDLTEEELSIYEKAEKTVKKAKAATNSQSELKKWINNWICENFSVDSEDCQEYSDTFYLLASLAGFDVRYQFGFVKNADGSIEGHVWNAIKVDNQWYYIDTYKNDGSDRMKYLNFVESDCHLINPGSEVVAVASKEYER